MRLNRVKQALREGGAVAGPFLGIPAPMVVELLGAAGCDFVLIDTEHSALDMLAAEDLIRAAELWNVTPIVRVYLHAPAVINKALDAGAQGLLLPHVDSADEARAIVQAARFTPLGQRGLGSVTRLTGYGTEDIPTYVQRANEETLIIAQIETVAGLRNLESILQVPGIDAIFIGPSDLSHSLGLPGQRQHPTVQAAIAEIAAKTRAAGLPLGTVAGDPQTARKLVAEGYQLIVFDTTRLIVNAAKSYMDGFHGQS